uniref:Mediator of RNA polymerase II transcription subunit 30 n=1 Tax=Sinocyclocheilus grahami TaxID=75366 RepID=A0A672RM54_SINGR
MSAPLPQKGLGPGMPVMPPQQHQHQQQQHQQQTHMPPGLAQPGMPPQGALREISPVYLCRIGQETTMHIFKKKFTVKIRIKFQETVIIITDIISIMCFLPSFQLVPYVGEETTPVRVEPCSPAVIQERQEVLEKVRQKNQEMKVLMDQMRNLLWDVNAMLTMRK